MKTEISPDQNAEVACTDSDKGTEATNSKQSLNLKVRARVGVETRTQLHAGSMCSGTLISGCNS